MRYSLLIITICISITCQNKSSEKKVIIDSLQTKPQTKEKSFEEVFDEKTRQLPIYSYQQIDQVLTELPFISFTQLDKDYIQKTGLEMPIYKSKLFYVVKGEMIYRYLVGKFRILDFMPKDEYYAENLESLKTGGNLQFLLLDKQVLYKLLELILALEKRNYQKEAFKINNGFRYPTYNTKVWGAEGSLHTLGMALDLEIEDIDNNGKKNKADKKIVLELLETEIIGKQGGIGYYPLLQTVHFDVRGWYARWDW